MVTSEPIRNKRTATNDVEARQTQAAELERRLQRTEQELAQARQQASTQSSGSRDRDTRIQALISFVVAGDDRLARQAIQAFNDSRTPDGITKSRYPTSITQIIPTSVSIITA